MVAERTSRGVTFDRNAASEIIFGEKRKDAPSQFLGKKDFKQGTYEDRDFSKRRAGKDYRKFGKTKTIEF